MDPSECKIRIYSGACSNFKENKELMGDVDAYIKSGIIESYVLGIVDADKEQEVAQMAATHAEIRAAIDTFSLELENHAMAHAITPDVTIKPFLMATIDYTERLQNGEAPTFPPLLHEGSSLADYSEWLTRTDLDLTLGFDEEFYAKIIGYTPQATTAIIWLKHGAPVEVHENELERFMIVEGTCDIIIGQEVHQLVPGDFLAIPLHKPHSVKVTSAIPCKLILQRVAA